MNQENNVPTDNSKLKNSASTTYREPIWQCVLIAWGEKYGVDVINGLADSIARHASVTPRFVLITDRKRVGLRSDIMTVDFPEVWLDEPLKRSGCQAKLAMFAKGVIPEDLPAIYVDLDTVVMGDLSELLTLQRTPKTVAILQSAVVPFGIIGRTIYRWSNKKRYARGNSSVVVYHPAQCHYIAEQFLDLYAQHPNFEFRPMIADERFMSWAAQPHMRALPRRWVVKFSAEYMSFIKPWLFVKAMLPWVRQRRKNQLAVTLAGLHIKPEILLALEDGAVIVDNKKRHMVWSKATLGDMKKTIRAYYTEQV